jgi:hypothetical protein
MFKETWKLKGQASVVASNEDMNLWRREIDKLDITLQQQQSGNNNKNKIANDSKKALCSRSNDERQNFFMATQRRWKVCLLRQIDTILKPWIMTYSNGISKSLYLDNIGGSLTTNVFFSRIYLCNQNADHP